MSEEKRPEVEIVQTHGMTMIGRGESNHWVVMDGPEKFRGHEGGTRPMELLLVSLGGCTGMDVISLMDKMRVPYDKLKVDISTERAEEHPKYYTKINIHYIIYGKGLPRDKVEKAISLTGEVLRYKLYVKQNRSSNPRLRDSGKRGVISWFREMCRQRARKTTSN